MRELALSDGVNKALVDDEDYERVVAKGSWYRAAEGERFAVKHKRSKTTIYLHRFILGAIRGQRVVHKDENALNNQKHNLKLTDITPHKVTEDGKYICKQCKQPKDKSEFYWRNDTEKLRSVCKDCQEKRQVAQRTPEIARRISLKTKYKITPEMWEYIFEQQGKRCAICNCDIPTGRGWQTDHNHATKKVRGVLCSRCNTMIGQARENKETLLNAARYLEEFENLPTIEVF